MDLSMSMVDDEIGKKKSGVKVPPSNKYRIVLERDPNFSQIAEREKILGETGLEKRNEIYILKNYDRLRMKLLRDNQDFYLAFKDTMLEMKKHFKKHKGKRTYPLIKLIPLFLFQVIVFFLCLYYMFIFCLLFSLNPMAILLSVAVVSKLYIKLYKFGQNKMLSYRFNEFKKLIIRLNEKHYDRMGLKLDCDHENDGTYIEFTFKNSLLNFEEQITKRRDRLLRNQDKSLDKNKYDKFIEIVKEYKNVMIKYKSEFALVQNQMKMLKQQNMTAAETVAQIRAKEEEQKLKAERIKKQKEDKAAAEKAEQEKQKEQELLAYAKQMEQEKKAAKRAAELKQQEDEKNN